MNICGEKYGRLTAIKQVGRDNSRQALWLFQCECGKTCVTRASSVRNGNTSSCGCFKKEQSSIISKQTIKNAHAANITHGRSKDRIYKLYGAMKQRCYNPHINNNEGYSPSNCRWVTMDVQCRNTSSCRFVTINGETKTITDWSIQYNINPNTVFGRLNRGMPPREAITTPVKKPS